MEYCFHGTIVAASTESPALTPMLPKTGAIPEILDDFTHMLAQEAFPVLTWNDWPSGGNI